MRFRFFFSNGSETQERVRFSSLDGSCRAEEEESHTAAATSVIMGVNCIF